MDEFEKKSLYNCRRDFHDQINIDTDFLGKLQDNGSISTTQRIEIEVYILNC
jgi:hypothetical protein